MGMDRAKDIRRNPSNLSPTRKKWWSHTSLNYPRLVESPGGGVGFRFQMKGMIEWAQKWKLKKIPGTKISPHLKKNK